MCIIFIAYGTREDYPLIIAANRDEFYNRPSAPAAWWEDEPTIFAGRDLAGGGTWLGVSRTGRFAAVTNYRDPKAPTGTVSRGALVVDFLKGSESASDYLAGIADRAGEFSGFNLIAGEISDKRRDLLYYSNRDTRVRELPPGIYGLSNHLLDTPWPKVAKGKARFTSIVENTELDKDEVFDLLADEALADERDLPETGVGPEIERVLSAVFIKTPGYGTRCSTVLTFDKDLKSNLDEHVFI